MLCHESHNQVKCRQKNKNNFGTFYYTKNEFRFVLFSSVQTLQWGKCLYEVASQSCLLIRERDVAIILVHCSTHIVALISYLFCILLSSRLVIHYKTFLHSFYCVAPRHFSGVLTYIANKSILVINF